MKYNLLKILAHALVLVIFSKCAQIGTLTGGKKDSTPPKALLFEPAQQTLNFSSDKVIIKFDEYIQLRDLNNQLVISPKLNTKPEITASGKILLITLKKEELLPNTTYRFYFGNAVADMHEGNALTNFSYIFSTGNIIDTLSLKGTVYGTLLKQKEKDVVVGLYYDKNLVDSFPFKSNPDYVTRTDEAGNFEITNLPPANFKLVCFTDKNKDYLYNGPDYDQFGFIKESIALKSDTAFKLDLFNEIPTKTFIKKVIMLENGKGLILFNQKTVTSLKPYTEGLDANLLNLKKGIGSDSCEFYYKNFKDSLWLKINYGNGSSKIVDTLELKIPVIRGKNKKLLKFSGNITKGALNYNEKPIVKLNHWIDTTKVNLNGMRIYSKADTSINSSPLSIRWIDESSFIINNVFKQKTNYHLKVDTNVFVGFNGLKNDSIKIPFIISKKTDLGSLVLSITFNLKQAYIIQLLNSANQVVNEHNVGFSLSSSNTASVTLKDLAEGDYRVRIIYDTNEDKIWNTGNFLKNITPEKTFIFDKVIKILPDWEVEQEFILIE